MSKGEDRMHRVGGLKITEQLYVISNEVAELQDHNLTLLRERDQFKVEFEKKTAEVNEVRRELFSLKAARIKSDSEHKRVIADLNESKLSNDVNRRYIEHLEADIKDIKKHSSMWRHYEVQRTTIDELNKEKVLIQERLHAANTSCNVMEKQIMQMGDVEMALRMDLTTAKEKLKNAQDALDGYKEEVEELKQIIRERKCDIDRKSDRIQELEDLVGDLEFKLRDKNKEIDQKGEVIRNLEDRIYAHESGCKFGPKI